MLPGDNAILARFDSITVGPNERESMQEVNYAFKVLASLIVNEGAPGQSQSLALTALEEASHWANRSIAENALTTEGAG